MVRFLNTNVSKQHDGLYVMVHKSGEQLGVIKYNKRLLSCDCWNYPNNRSRGMSTVYIKQLTDEDYVYNTTDISYNILEKCVSYSEAYCNKRMVHDKSVVSYTDKHRNLIMVNENPNDPTTEILKDIYNEHKLLYSKRPKIVEIVDFEMIYNVNRQYIINNLINQINNLYKNSIIVTTIKDDKIAEILERNQFVNLLPYDTFEKCNNRHYMLYTGNEQGEITLRYILDDII